MTIQGMEHVGIVVDDLAAATEFFLELGLVLQGEGPVEGHLVNRVVGLGGVRADFAIMQTAAALRPYAGAQPRAWTSLRPVLERTLSVRIQETGTELSALALRCAS